MRTGAVAAARDPRPTTPARDRRATTPAARADRPAVLGGALEVREEVRPPWPFRLGGASMDGLLRRRGAALQRLLRIDGEPVLVGIVQPANDRVVFAARATTEAAARAGIARMRFATAVDDDLRPFYDRFHDDPVIGRAVRANPRLRVRRQPDPWETLLGAITEQLIELQRAMEIQRRLIAAFGYRCPHTRMRDAPAAEVIARQAPARLTSFDLAPKRAIAMRRCAAEVASGRVDLARHDLRRLQAIREIGPWTLEMVGLHGQGRYDVVPAGDLGFLKIVGRLLTGNPKARADEAEVRGFFERYGEWKGLAGAYLVHAAARGLIATRWSRDRALRPAGTRWSAAPARPRAA